jgi:hypothetical protein
LCTKSWPDAANHFKTSKQKQTLISSGSSGAHPGAKGIELATVIP